MRDIEESKRLHSGAYVKMYESKPISRLARLIPLMRLQGKERLADIACGNAMLLPLIHAKISHYDGVDFSEDFIVSAKSRAEKHKVTNCSFHCQDIMNFCAEHPETFDLATAFDFSEHIEDEAFLSIFKAVRDTLIPNGRLLLHTPNLNFFMERLKDWGILHQFPEHIAVRNQLQNTRLLQRCGFAPENIHVRVLPHYNILRLTHPLRHIPVFGRLFEARLFIECIK